MEKRGSSKMAVLKEPHGFTFQKTTFIKGERLYENQFYDVRFILN
jgi:hypothetical protein